MKKLFVLFVLLLIPLIVLAKDEPCELMQDGTTDCHEEEPELPEIKEEECIDCITIQELCEKTKGNWISTGHSQQDDDGFCNCGSGRYWKNNVEGCKDISNPSESLIINTGGGSSEEDYCNLDQEGMCDIKLERWKIESYTINHIEKDYKMEFMGWSWVYWIIGEEVAVVRISDDEGNRIFWRAIPKNIAFGINQLGITINVNSVSLNKVDMTLETF